MNSTIQVSVQYRCTEPVISHLAGEHQAVVVDAAETGEVWHAESRGRYKMRGCGGRPGICITCYYNFLKYFSRPFDVFLVIFGD